MEFYTIKSPGVLELDTGASPITLTFTPERAFELWRRLHLAGFHPGEARSLGALTSPRPNDLVLAEALTVLGGVSNADDILEECSRRMTSWNEGLGRMVREFYDVDRGDYDKDDCGRYVAPGEVMLGTEDGRSFRVRITFKVLRRLTRGLATVGYDPSQSAPQAAFEGVLDEVILAFLISIVSEGEDCALETMTIEEAWGFLMKNRKRLWGWWLHLQEATRERYRKEVAEIPSGEAVGAGDG